MKYKIRKKGITICRKTKRPAWFDILETNYPQDFAEFVPKRKDDNPRWPAPEWFVDSPAGETIACGFKSRAEAKRYKNVYVPGGFIRKYDPLVRDHERNLSERRQERRFQALSSGRSK